MLTYHGTVRKQGLWLTASYISALAAVGLVTLATSDGLLPTFFRQGQGGTPLRQLVLICAVGMFAGSAALLGLINRRAPSPFASWYSLALMLVAAGLAGVLVEPSFDGPLS